MSGNNPIRQEVLKRRHVCDIAYLMTNARTRMDSGSVAQLMRAPHKRQHHGCTVHSAMRIVRAIVCKDNLT